MKLRACERCGADNHAPHEDGLFECIHRLEEQRDDARDEAEARTIAAVVAMLREQIAKYDQAVIDYPHNADLYSRGAADLAGHVEMIERGDWRSYLPKDPGR